MSDQMHDCNMQCKKCPCSKDGYPYHGCIHITNPSSELEEYFSVSLLSKLKLEASEPPEDYIEKLIYNYFHNIKEEINVDKVISLLDNTDKYSFYYTPIILFILQKHYDRYFVKQEQL